ncbi:MAG: hypothetical protein ABIO24_03870, partial [Saprospiraceae bacterium]
MPVPASGDCEIHTLTSAGDWKNLVWSLKSFYHFAGRRFPLVIHQDGSLPSAAQRTLEQHFPGCRLIRNEIQTPKTMAMLSSGYPRCRHLRETNTLSRKLFDLIACLNAPTALLLDSDLLFFSLPTVFLNAATAVDSPNVFNGDV